MWYLVHTLELAIKDALKTTFFVSVDGMLLNLYLLYSKSPKKCRQLEEVIADLKECFALVDGGSKPIRACGSRWIGHKWNAMKRVLARYGAYTNHLSAMSEDRSFKSMDRAKILGYYRQRTNAKYILGCAVFIDLLTPCVSLSKVMQQDNLDILAAFTGLVKSVKELEKLESSSLQQRPIYVATVKKCLKKGENTIYQAQQLKILRHSRDILQKPPYQRLHTNQEQHQIKASVIRSPILSSSLQHRGVQEFTIPLQGAGADIAEIHACYVAIHMPVHLSLNTQLPRCMVVSLSCTSFYRVEQRSNTSGATFFLTSVERNT